MSKVENKKIEPNINAVWSLNNYKRIAGYLATQW